VVPARNWRASARAGHKNCERSGDCHSRGEARAVRETRKKNSPRLGAGSRAADKCFASEDCGEGIRAFFEKRPPKFQASNSTATKQRLPQTFSSKAPFAVNLVRGQHFQRLCLPPIIELRQLHERSGDYSGGDQATAGTRRRRFAGGRAEPWEFEICRIEGAKLIPMGTVPANLQALDTDTNGFAIVTTECAAWTWRCGCAVKVSEREIDVRRNRSVVSGD